MSERVTLLLGKDRVEVSRDDLISKSEYFACLMSPNFRDHQSSEHRIHYDIDMNTLQTFVNWISDHVPSVIGDCRYVKPSLVKYVVDSAKFEDLLKLLQLSVLFVSATLINDLTDLIACHWLIPQKCVQIWLLARELGLATLRDLAKATCIDRLKDVPESLLLELPRKDFVELVGNIRVKFSSTFPFEVLQRWVNRNVSPGECNVDESQYPFTLLQDHISYDSSEVKKMFDDQYWRNNIQCIVGRKQIADNEAKEFIFVWDGITFAEIIDLTNSFPFNTALVIGMHYVGRGFDIYLLGGEYRSHSRENFQMEIWRYSLISKTWYYVTSMPRPRRFMMIYFLNEKLFLIGQDQEQPDEPGVITADMYNIHTGQWKQLPNIRGSTWAYSLVFERQGSLLVLAQDEIHSYDEDKNSWSKIDWILHGVEIEDTASWGRFICTDLFMTYGNYIYILGSYEGEYNKNIMRIFSVKDSEPYKIHPLHIGDCVTSFYRRVANGPYVIGFGIEEDTLCVEVIKMIDKRSFELKTVYKDENIGVVCDIVDSFNVYNANSLNQLFVLEKEAK